MKTLLVSAQTVTFAFRFRFSLSRRCFVLDIVGIVVGVYPSIASMGSALLPRLDTGDVLLVSVAVASMQLVAGTGTGPFAWVFSDDIAVRQELGGGWFCFVTFIVVLCDILGLLEYFGESCIPLGLLCGCFCFC
jgi:hypothetical protein